MGTPLWGWRWLKVWGWGTLFFEDFRWIDASILEHILSYILEFILGLNIKKRLKNSVYPKKVMFFGGFGV